MKYLIYILFSCLSIFTPKIDANLLPIDKAFDFKVESFADKTKIKLSIADEYFVIKDSFKIYSKKNNTNYKQTISDYTYSSNNNAADEQVFYRNTVDFLLPIENINNKDVALYVDFQGCSNTKGCYANSKKILNLTTELEKNKKTFINAEINTKNKSFKKQNDIISIDEAFKLNLIKIDDSNIKIKWLIVKDYYLYKDKIFIAADGATIEQITHPKSKIKNDIFFGDVDIYDKSFDSIVSLKDINKDNIQLEISYQGCWDQGVCFPPQSKQYNIEYINKTPQTNITATKKQNKPTSNIYNQINDSKTLFEKSIFALIIGAFIAGLGLALTPCVYPMLPILSSTIIGRKDSFNTIKTIKISSVFVIFMAITYALIGAVAGYLGYGTNINAYFQTAIVIIPICIMLAFFAFSMLGYYEIQVPKKIQQKIDAITAKQQGGNFIGVAIMGILSALIVSPCITPFIATSLTYIIIEGSPIKGAIALFAMGIGMGVPLIIVCGWGMKIMPKSGVWMEKIKNIFGILILGVAIYLLDRVVSNLTSLILWAILFTAAPIYLGAVKPIKKLINFWQLFFKLITITALIYSAVLWVFIIKGDHNYHPLYDFQYLFSNSYEQKTEFIATKSNKHLDYLLDQAEKNNKITVLKFDADWCISCKIMEKNIFSNNVIAYKLQDTVNIVVDVTNNTNNNQDLLNKFNLIGPPAILFFKNKQELKDERIIGEINKQDFLKILNLII